MEKLQGPDADDARFAANMQRRREEVGISQADLVRTLRSSGWSTVHPTTISRIENGDRPVRLGEARAIARALGVGVEHLLLSPAESQLVDELVRRGEGVRTAWRGISTTTVAFLTERVELEGVIEQGRGHLVKKSKQRPADDQASADTTSALENALAEAVEVLDLDAVDAVNEGRSAFEQQRAGKGRAGEA